MKGKHLEYTKGDIVVLDLSLDGNPTQRTFLVHGNDEVFEIIEGYNITSTGFPDPEKNQFLTNVPLKPSPTNGLKAPSVIKMESLYLINNQKNGKVIGHLSPAEQAVIDTYHNIYNNSSLNRRDDFGSIEKREADQLKLYEAIQDNDDKEVKRLLDEGASPNATGTENAPLHLAAIFGHEKCAEELLKKGACISTLNTDEKTPLELAIAADNVAAAEVLLRYGADPDISVRKDNQQEKSEQMEQLLQTHSDNISSRGKLSTHPEQQRGGGRR